MKCENGAIAQYTGGGSVFVTPGKTSYRLYDLSITGYSPATKPIAQGQIIQFFTPGGAKVDRARTYYNWQGKWYYKFTTDTTVANAEAPDIEIPAGTGFMCNFGKPNSVLNYAGEVLINSTGLTVSTGIQYFLAYNPYPVAIKLSQLSTSNYSPATKPIAQGQIIQFFEKGSSCKVDKARTYYNFQGKWYYKFTTDTTVANAAVEDFDIGPGEGFLCNFGKTDTRLNFPALDL